MENVNIFKALAHPTRLRILSLLKTPSQSFPLGEHLDKDRIGVCVYEIQLELDISQSTTSQHLAILEEAGLLISTKIGKYTYFKRNEAVLKQLADDISKKI